MGWRVVWWAADFYGFYDFRGTIPLGTSCLRRFCLTAWNADPLRRCKHVGAKRIRRWRREFTQIWIRRWRRRIKGWRVFWATPWYFDEGEIVMGPTFNHSSLHSFIHSLFSLTLQSILNHPESWILYPESCRAALKQISSWLNIFQTTYKLVDTLIQSFMPSLIHSLFSLTHQSILNHPESWILHPSSF